MSVTLIPREAVSPEGNSSDLAMGQSLLPDDHLQLLPERAALAALPRSNQFDILKRLTGWTPFVRVGELGIHRKVNQKLEYLNPSGSHYDRAYIENLRQLEESGLIHPGTQLRDITSGSAGISLAFVGYYLGYPTRITVPDELPVSRTQPATMYGAEIVRSGPGYIRAAHDFQKNEMVQMIREGWHRIKSTDPDMRAVIFEKDGQRVCYVNHSENSITPQAFQNIGHEIVAQSGIGLKPSAVVLALGNFTTVRGIHDAIKPIWPDTQIIGYDGGARSSHNNYGTSVAGFSTRFMDESLLDARFTVSDEERDRMSKRINTNRPIEHRIGHSSLMGLVVADMLASELHGPIVSIAYDRAERY